MDDFSKESLEIAVDYGISGQYVTRVLDQVARFRGYPAAVRTDECLNEQWFESLPQARECIARWRQDYNEVRPHSSLGRIPPARFAQQHRQRAGGAADHPQRQNID